MTAAELAAIAYGPGRPPEWPAAALTTRDQAAIRDIPTCCTCRWTYVTGPARWVRDQPARSCPWHQNGAT